MIPPNGRLPIDISPLQQPNQPPTPPAPIPFDTACGIYRTARLAAVAAHKRYSIDGTEAAHVEYSKLAELANRALAAVNRAIEAEARR